MASILLLLILPAGEKWNENDLQLVRSTMLEDERERI